MLLLLLLHVVVVFVVVFVVVVVVVVVVEIAIVKLLSNAEKLGASTTSELLALRVEVLS